MKSFYGFLEDMEDGKSVPELSDDVIYRICKVAWRKHRKATEEFIMKLSDEDNEIADLLSDIRGDGEHPIPQEDKGLDKDEVVPPEADGSPGLNDQ